MNKICLDTSVLLDNTNVIELLKETEIVIPFCVLSELDGKRRLDGPLGKNARDIVKKIDKIFENGDVFLGVTTEQGSLLRVAESNHESFPTNDLKIIQTAKLNNCKVLSNDIGLRIQARGMGVEASGFEKETSQNEIFQTATEISLPEEMINEIHDKNFVSIQSNTISSDSFYPNQSFIIRNTNTGKANTLARFVINHNGERLLQKVYKRDAWGVTPDNSEQSFAMELLLDTSVELMSLVGRAGSGKTFLVVAAGLEQVIESKIYDRIIVLRPIVSVGNRDIGFLPGSMEDKMAPWIQPVKDNLLQLIKNKKTMDFYFENGTIDVQHIGYIRGRSIPRSYIIVDECQNITKEELKTILTRAAIGSKIVLTGDVEQIDNKKLDLYNNGLSQVVSSLMNEEITGHVVLEKCHRSKIAELAATNL